jgi:UPF0042 nucleotide-binding protein
MSIFIITGISGSGKSVALRALEDAGYDCVDNLPVSLLENLVETLQTSGSEHIAVAIDARRGLSIQEIPTIIAKLKKHRSVQLIFLNATNEALLKRFSETRRRHPLSAKNLDHSQKSLIDAIDLERQMLSSLSENALQIDTSNALSSSLRQWILDLTENTQPGLTLLLESFGFKSGLPQDADLVFDLRCIPNPYYEDTLRHLSGNDQQVVDFLNLQPDFEKLRQDILLFIHNWLPKYQKSGRSYLTVGVGCTGGQHRSVAMVNHLFLSCSKNQTDLFKNINCLYRHRDLSAAHNKSPH